MPVCKPHAHLERHRQSAIEHRRVGRGDLRRPELQGALCREAGSERIRSIAEYREYPIARGLDDASVGRLDRITQHPVVSRERSPHCNRISLPQRRAALDVREEERDGAAWERRHTRESM
jgi:hypothetical protein